MLDKNDGTDIIHTHFEKAFDKVPRNRLLFKLKQYGLNNNVLLRIENYLINKRH